MEFEFETERLRFRRLDDRDLDPISEMFAHPEVMRFALDGTRDRAGTETWLRGHEERFGTDGPYGFRAAIEKSTGAYTGHVGLLRQEVEGEFVIEVGYWLHHDHWGKGYATEAAIAFRDKAFLELDADHVVSLIVPENLASQAVAKRNGMREERPVVFKGIHALQFGIHRVDWEATR